MTEKSKLFPGYYWNPKNGEERVTAHSEADIPEGWINTHPNNVQAVETVSETPAAGEMSREEIIAALDAGGVSFDKNTKTHKLAAKLREAVVKFLKDGAIPYDDKSSTKELLKLLPPAE